MDYPNKAQVIYANTKMVEPMIRFLRDSLEGCEFDDLELLSDFDKATLSLRCAINRMNKIIERNLERKSVCY